LQKDQIKGIAGLQLDILQQRLSERELSLNITDQALEYIVEEGYDPVYGARPLRRAIQQLIENPLAEEIIAGKYLPGSVIDVARDGDLLMFTAGAVH
jgi:ATP-dependent Clp protease ATP-binding subunit ClpB